MAVGVVDRLEPVDVEHEHAERVPEAGGPLHLAGEHRRQVPEVVDPGERVGDRQPLDLLVVLDVGQRGARVGGQRADRLEGDRVVAGRARRRGRRRPRRAAGSCCPAGRRGRGRASSVPGSSMTVRSVRARSATSRQGAAGEVVELGGPVVARAGPQRQLAAAEARAAVVVQGQAHRRLGREQRGLQHGLQQPVAVVGLLQGVAEAAERVEERARAGAGRRPRWRAGRGPGTRARPRRPGRRRRGRRRRPPPPRPARRRRPRSGGRARRAR